MCVYVWIGLCLIKIALRHQSSSCKFILLFIPVAELARIKEEQQALDLLNKYVKAFQAAGKKPPVSMQELIVQCKTPQRAVGALAEFARQMGVSLDAPPASSSSTAPAPKPVLPPFDFKRPYSCAICTFFNTTGGKNCGMCGTPRDVATEQVKSFLFALMSFCWVACLLL